MGELLVADDDRGIREMLSGHFRGEGLRVRAYSDGNEVMDHLESMEEPDVAVLDIAMPGDGIATAVKLKERFANIPVFFFTAYADSERKRAEANNVRAAGWIDKGPNALEEIDAAVKHTMGLREVARACREGRLRMAERYDGVVEHVHKDTVVVVYGVGEDLVEQTYERNQFLDRHLPSKGDHLAVFIHVAQLPFPSKKESLDTEVIHEPYEDWRTPIKGDVQT